MGWCVGWMVESGVGWGWDFRCYAARVVGIVNGDA